MKKFLLIGQAVKPQGVRGEIKVLPATDDVERFCDLENVFLDEKGEICKKVESAREILRFSDRAVAEVVEKVLNSAVANAEHNHHMSTRPNSGSGADIAAFIYNA